LVIFLSPPGLQAHFLLEFRSYMQYEKIRVTSLPDGGKCLTICAFILTHHHVTDTQMETV